MDGQCLFGHGSGSGIHPVGCFHDILDFLSQNFFDVPDGWLCCKQLLLLSLIRQLDIVAGVDELEPSLLSKVGG